MHKGNWRSAEGIHVRQSVKWFMFSQVKKKLNVANSMVVHWSCGIATASNWQESR